MIRFIIRRVLLSIVVLAGVSFISSGMMLIAGDPIEVMLEGTTTTEADKAALRRELGFDRPFLQQYAEFVLGAVRGDLGKSLRFHESAADIVLARVPATLRLSVAAMVIAVLVAVPLGIVSAARPNSPPDYAARLVSLLGQSIPLFWLGIVLVLVFSVRLGWLPSAGDLEAKSIVLPALTLGMYPMARIARTLRASLLDVLAREYILTARGKGLKERTVLSRHALRNAALPVLTIIGLQFGLLLGGAVVTETIFAWPGLGLLAVQSISWRDLPLLRAIVTIAAAMLVTVNLATDVLYAFVDPRIRLR
jgi:ABC-type dipeptide/oligopeptide/nickel transport system permease component